MGMGSPKRLGLGVGYRGYGLPEEEVVAAGQLGHRDGGDEALAWSGFGLGLGLGLGSGSGLGLGTGSGLGLGVTLTFFQPQPHPYNWPYP